MTDEERQRRLMASLAGANPMPLSSETPFRFSIAQLCTICAGIVLGTVTVLSYVDKVRQSVEQLNNRVGQMEESLRETNAHLKAQDARTREWDTWRWTVTRDIVQMGRKTSVEIWTKEEK